MKHVPTVHIKSTARFLAQKFFKTQLQNVLPQLTIQSVTLHQDTKIMPHLRTAIKIVKFQDFTANFLGNIKWTLRKKKKNSKDHLIKLSVTYEERLMIMMKAHQV